MPELPPIYTSLILCSDVLKEDSGVVSAIRIVDTFIGQRPAGVDMTKVLALIEFWILVIFKCESPCDFTATISGSGPKDTKAMNPQSFPIHLPGDVGGHNVMVRVTLGNAPEGLYWFSVTINGQVAQRTPARITYPEQTTEQSTPSQIGPSSD